MHRTVLVAEDRQILAESLALGLANEGISSILAMEPDLDRVLRLAAESNPETAIVAMGFGTGMLTEQVIGALTAEGIPTLVMTGGSDRLRLARCVAEGAVGIIEKSSSFAAVAAIIGERADVAGSMSPAELYALQDELRRYRSHVADQRRPFERLTSREREVLRMLTEGLRAEEIAEHSYVSISTVRTQIRAVLTKLGVSSQLAAVAMANRANWFDPSARPVATG
jgi:DNA-binding NarL/FixJ family response regulator